MSDRTIHLAALAIIASSGVAKIISLLFLGWLHPNLKIFEFISIGVYFLYIGWLGWYRREGATHVGRYIGIATIIIVFDILVYFIFQGWA